MLENQQQTQMKKTKQNKTNKQGNEITLRQRWRESTARAGQDCNLQSTNSPIVRMQLVFCSKYFVRCSEWTCVPEESKKKIS